MQRMKSYSNKNNYYRNSEKVDFVSIATPNHTHAKIAVAAAVGISRDL